MERIRKHFSPALVLSVVAVFIALGGGAYAALGKNSVGSKQIKKNAVVTSKIKNNAVTTGTLTFGPNVTNQPLTVKLLGDTAVEGPEAFKVWRTMMGTTNPREAAPGTIRGDLAIEMGENLVHGSDSPESAAREVALFFPSL